MAYPTEQISDSSNFGDWLVKINEVIEELNSTRKLTNEAKEDINNAFSSGQLGDAINVSSEDDCTHSGLYHINEEDANIYVASNGTCVTQIKVTENENPQIFIRSNSNGAFTDWMELTNKKYVEETYLPLTGGSVGYLTVSGHTKTNTLSSGDVTFTGKITQENNSGVLTITNNQSNIIFDGNMNNTPHIAYYVNGDKVTIDKQGKNVVYYIHTDANNTSTLVHYNVVYFIQKHLDTLNTYDKNEVDYYIQRDGRVTRNKSEEDKVTYFYKVGNVVLDEYKKKLKYFLLDDNAYEFSTQYYINNNVVYREIEYTSKAYDVEGDEIVDYSPIGIIKTNRNVVTSYDDENKILYYIHSFTKDDKIIKYLSKSNKEESQREFYLTNEGVYLDEECTQLYYYVRDDVIAARNVMYYILTKSDIYGNEYTAWSPDKKVMSMYSYNNEVIILEAEPKYVIKHYKDTLSSDKEGIDTRFYIQSDNSITSDYIGTQERYILRENFIASIHSKDVPYLYVWDTNKLISHTTCYYIQTNNKVTSDKEGLNVLYIYDRDNNYLLNVNKPIYIDLIKNVCDINGNARTADELSQRGITHSFTSGETNKVASGKAVMDLKESIDGKFIPFTGGIFTGLVSHTEDILLGKKAKIRAYERLNFHSLGDISFVVNSEEGNIFIDRQGDLDKENYAYCSFGARICEGVTNSESGDPIYTLGSVEFSEKNTRLRYRAVNYTDVIEGKDDKSDVSLYLNSTQFYPSKNNTISLGIYNNRFSTLYLRSGQITSSDKTSKTDINFIDTSLLKKWKDINWKSYKLVESVEEKGENARIHTGLIAQEVRDALSEIDISKYGFFCEDDGFLSLRYQEAQAIENAYLREEIKSLKEELKQIKKLLK